MKKILALAFCFLLIGCGKSFDIDKAIKNIDTLKNVGYDNLEEVSNDDMKNIYSIDSSKAEYISFKKSKDSNEVDLYLIVKVKNEEITEKIDAYFESLELHCEMYDPENASKVKNRLEDKVNGYNIYIISDDNEKVLETFKSIKNIN